MSPYTPALAAVLDAAPITRAERRAARDWYARAREVAVEVAAALDVEVTTGAAIVAAYSIRNDWRTNVAHARQYAAGQVPPGLRQRTVIADACLTHGLDALRGPKTNAFARAIVGDPGAVPVDVWMCRAAGLDVDSPTGRQHEEIADAVRDLAPIYRLPASACQALIWMRVRGSDQ